MRGKERKQNSGITLIALVITIIILLILAGVSIATLTGENGLLTKANTAKTENVKRSAEEKVKIAVAGSLDTDGKIDLNDLNDNLRQVEGLTDILYNDESIMSNNKIEKLPIDIIVDGYTVEIDENGKVTLKVPKPQVAHTISPETQVEEGEEITITITATISEGTIVKITRPDGTEVKNINETTYIVTENDDYKFIVEGSNGEKTTHVVEITNGKNVEKFSDIYTETKLYTDKEGKTAKIPEGFAVGTSKNINTVDNGLVITDEIDENHKSTGNEFVWVPVDNPSDFKRRNKVTKIGITMTDITSNCSEPFSKGSQEEKENYDNMEKSVISNKGFYCRSI